MGRRWVKNFLTGKRVTLRNHPLVNRYLQDHSLEGARMGWGYRFSGLRSQASGRPYVLFEDAFVRSLKPGYEGALYGLSVDRKGAIFDAQYGCDLVDLITQKTEVMEGTLSLMGLFRERGISKYNWFLEQDVSAYRRGVLLVDQSRGDASMRYGGMSELDFTRMFQDALTDFPEDVIYVRTHPDLKHRQKKSCFSSDLLSHPRVQILSSDLPPQQCFTFCHTVFVGTSLLGMEALVHGCQVITYGWNFYAGWGLTVDRTTEEVLPRPREATVEQVFESAYVDYCHYYDPDLGEPCDLEHIIQHIAFQKTRWREFAGECYARAHDPWKKKLFSLYVKGPQTELSFAHSPSVSPQAVYTWGRSAQSEREVRVEDGFLRSKGLGVAFNLPLSLVFDDEGIYFDASAPSRLESLLGKVVLSPSQENEAQELLSLICKKNLTKYNFPSVVANLPEAAKGNVVIFVPGQVESDASVQLSSPRVQSNEELLKRVREANPEAFICFRPHPDLMARLRKGSPVSHCISQYCDHLALEGDVVSWLKLADEVHTMTSTVGFEALLHGKKVVTYGMPFYAGWGLTQDFERNERRQKRLSLLALVHVCFIQYPVYLNPNTGEYISAKKAASLLATTDYKTARAPFHWQFLLVLKGFRNRCLG